MGKGKRRRRAIVTAEELAQLEHEVADVRAFAETCLREASRYEVILACVLEKLAENGACVLTMPERERAFDQGWGITTQVLDDARKPMIVKVRKEVNGG